MWLLIALCHDTVILSVMNIHTLADVVIQYYIIYPCIITIDYYDDETLCTYICHPSPSNSKQETTNSMSHVTVVAGLLLTLDHYQPQITLKLHIKYCTLDDKIVA